LQARFGPDGVSSSRRGSRGRKIVSRSSEVHIFERTAMIGLDRSRPAVVRPAR
jgi:hypothetical protein